jgi:hypothetical protein
VTDEEDIENIPPTTPKKGAMLKQNGETTSGDRLTSGLPPTPVSNKKTISLFTPSKRLVSTTPTKTPTTTPSKPLTTVFTRAKALLRKGTVPGKLTARSSERSQICSFLSHQLGKVKRGAFLYICGPPGTGKTALMNEIYAEYQECPSMSGVGMTFINCMSFSKAEEVFDQIIEDFGGNQGFVDAQLERLFLKRDIMSYVPNLFLLIQIGGTRRNGSPRHEKSGSYV